MGGLLILTAALVPTLLWADLTNAYVWIAVLATAGVRRDRLRRRLPEDRPPLASRAAARATRWAGRSSSALAVGVVLLVPAQPRPLQHAADLPVLQAADSGSRLAAIVPFAVFVLVGSIERREPDRRPRRPGDQHVRGRGGGATPRWPTSPATACSPNYLLLVRFPPAAELTIFCGALVGASLGFLWYNSLSRRDLHGRRRLARRSAARSAPSRILIKQELLLPIVGGVFVLEALSVDHPGRVVQADRPARVQDGAAPPPLRADRLERAEGHHAVRDRRDHLRAVQPDDAEAAMTHAIAFSVRGKRVIVVGAARSGVAAAELLVRRGAHVTLTDAARRASPTSERLRERGRRRSSSAAIAPATLARRRSDRAQPGRAARSAGDRRGARGRACRSSARSSSRRAGCAAGSSRSPARRASRRRRR